MVIKKEDAEKIVWPNSKYGKEIFKFLVSEIEKDSRISTKVVARIWCKKNGIPDNKISVIAVTLSEFRKKYYFLNETNPKERTNEAATKNQPIHHHLKGKPSDARNGFLFSKK